MCTHSLTHTHTPDVDWHTRIIERVLEIVADRFSLSIYVVIMSSFAAHNKMVKTKVKIIINN